MSKVLEVSEVGLDGVHLVEAAAGTGKTYNITALYIRLIAEKGLRVDQILVVTYTRAATRELRERIDARLRQALAALQGKTELDECDDFIRSLHTKYHNNAQVIDRISRAIHEIDLAAIFTIHGFCRQVLQEHVFESGTMFDVEFITNETELLDETHDDIWRELIAWAEDSPLRFPAFQYLVDQLKSPDGLTLYTSAVKGKPFVKVYDGGSREVEEICRNYQELWHELKENWDPEGIESLLSDKSRIKQKSFNKKRTPKRIAGMDELLASDEAPYNPSRKFPDFEKFTLETINEYRTGELADGRELPHQRFFELCGELHKLVQSGELELALLSYIINEFRRRYEQAKKDRKVRSYDDLLISLSQALEQPELVRVMQKEYPAALIDEFQDTDPVQFEVFDKIYIDPAERSLSLFLIGDPKQSIYSFRGADIFTYIRAKQKVQHHWTLDTNYRSVEKLVEAVNRLFSYQKDRPFLLEEITFEPIAAHKKGQEPEITDSVLPKEPLQILKRPDHDLINKDQASRRVAVETAMEIERVLAHSEHFRIEGQPVRARDIAVLVSRHVEGTMVKEELARRGIRSVNQSRRSVFQSPELEYMLMLLYSIREPSNPALLRALLCSRIGGFTFSGLQFLREDEEAWLSVLDRIRYLNELFRHRGVMPMWQEFLNAPLTDANEYNHTPLEVILEYADGERTLTNLQHLAELINEYTRSGMHGLDDLIKWINRKKEEPGGNEDEELRLESDHELVKIITMHSAKGLQFPVVFCPYLWSGINDTKPKPPMVFHESGERRVDLNGLHDRAGALVLRESVSEQLRLAYVALTRAQFRCYVGWVPYEKQALSPLAGLLFGAEYLRNIIENSGTPNVDEHTLPEAFEKLASLEHIGITEPAEVNGKVGEQDGASTVAGAARVWKRGEVLPSWYITSYSGLKQGMQAEPDNPFADEGGWDDTPGAEEQGTDVKNIFSFPKGARPGIFMHRIFELIDFTAPEEVINREIDWQLDEFDFDPHWQPAIRGMTHQALQAPLLHGDDQSRLANIKPGQCLQEMEFHFRISEAEVNEIERIVSGEQSSSNGRIQAPGYMKGFIDLVFEYQGKYYILDYKSDYLGNRPEDYQTGKLSAHIRDRSYDLQFHIYTVALCRYLQTRMPGFQYDNHFGGVIYLFLRGVGGGNGVYFDRPAHETVRSLDKYFSPELAG